MAKRGGNGGGITGNKRDNVLNGTEAGEVIDGQGGNDRLSGAGGDDTILGGEGVDTAVFSGSRGDYAITDLGDGSIVIEGPDGSDTVSGVEWFEFDDITMTLAEVLVPLEPNLSAGTLALDATDLLVGDIVTLSFGVSSTGTVGTPTSDTTILVAADEGGTDIVASLSAPQVAALDTGEAATIEATLDTSGFAPGTYWIAVALDPEDVVGESDEGDNRTEWVRITVAAPVDDLQLSASLASVSDFDLTDGAGAVALDYTVTNASNTGPADWTLRTVLSRDDTVSAEDTEVFQTTGTTGQGQTTVLSSPTLAIQPGDLGMGGWHVLTVLDWADGTPDATLGDNATSDLVAVIEPVADLVMISAVIQPESDLDLTDGGSIRITYDTASVGTIAPSGVLIRSYLSTDDTISSDDMQILGISGGAATTVTTTHYFQSHFEAGDYKLISVIEWSDGTADATPGDNVIVQDVTFTPAPLDIGFGYTSFTATDAVLDADGGQIRVYSYLENDSAIDATGNFALYLSADNVFDTADALLGARDIFLEGGFYGSTVSIFDIAPGLVAPGAYTVFWVNQTPGDADPSNDIASGTVVLESAPLPDVSVDAVTVTGGDATLDSDGVALEFAVDLTEIGGVATPVELTAWLSSDGAVSADDVAIWSASINLTENGAATLFGTGALDGMDLTPGDWQIIVVADAVGDADPSNDIGSAMWTLSAGVEKIVGTEGSDTLAGTAGDDEIDALGGDDRVIATTGLDLVNGGDGIDTADFSTLAAGIEAVGDYYLPGTMSVVETSAYNQLGNYAGFERIVATDYDDIVSLYGSGVSEAYLGDGNDQGQGSDGSDVIDGGAGDDFIFGYLGNDTLTTGSGSDVVAIARDASSGTTLGFGHDIVTDFDTAFDLVVIDNMYADPWDPLAHLVQTAEGARLDYAEDSSLLLLGVYSADLTANHFADYQDPVVETYL